MKNRIFESKKEVDYKNKKYTVYVYGEMIEENDIEGYYIVPIKFNGKTKKISLVDLDKKQHVTGYNQYFSRTKSFNMGWAICAEPDVFDREEGIKIAKRRFSRSPLKTQNGRFLTSDMCQSIVENEVEYVSKHIDAFLPKEADVHVLTNDETNSLFAKRALRTEEEGDKLYRRNMARARKLINSSEFKKKVDTLCDKIRGNKSFQDKMMEGRYTIKEMIDIINEVLPKEDAINYEKKDCSTEKDKNELLLDAINELLAELKANKIDTVDEDKSKQKYILKPCKANYYKEGDYVGFSADSFGKGNFENYIAILKDFNPYSEKLEFYVAALLDNNGHIDESTVRWNGSVKPLMTLNEVKVEDVFALTKYLLKQGKVWDKNEKCFKVKITEE